MSDALLTLTQAIRIAEGTMQAANEGRYAPLSVAVLDLGGHVLALLRDERASLYRPQIAFAKASGCLGMGFGGRELEKRALAVPQFYAALSSIFPNGIVPVPGGILVRTTDGILCGAVGVSGDTSDNDESCAVAGIRGQGFVADTGTSPNQNRKD